MFRFVLLAGCGGLLAVAAGCSDTGAADAQAIKAKSEDWIKAAAAKDAAKFASVYADDATIMFANEPAFKGIDAIKNVMTPSMQDPNYALSFKMDRIEVSGILAYVQGTLSHTTTGRDGKPFVDTGKFLTIWKKQADGSWKIVADISNSDLPPGGA